MGASNHLQNDPRPGSPIDHQPMTWKEMIKKWPKQTFLIVGNELCERFSFYGMRAVLTLYFFNILGFSKSFSTVLFHAFTVICYTSPLLGSILADGYIGKFWTIFSISIFYACGQILLAFSSIAPSESSHHPFLDLMGLLIVGLGTGGIKPCVSAFGGDQFPAHYTRMISIFFSMFYFSINAGSLVSMALTPYMRSMSCFGHDSCYPLAFGIPAFLMIIATLVFMSGSFWYKKVGPKENIIFKVIGTIVSAIRNKISSSSTHHRSHWLDYSLKDHDCASSPECRELHGNCAQRRYIGDIKQLFRVIVMMIPVPMFWALYDQQGSTWVLQAIGMDANVFGWEILPDQMGVLNAFLILFFIPIFQSLVYPGIERLGIEMTMLRKMASGGVLTALSFFICGVVQLFVNSSLPYVPMANEAHLTIINTHPSCDFKVWIDSKAPFDLPRKTGINPEDLVSKPISFTGESFFQPNITFDNNSSPNCPKFTAHPTLAASTSYVLTLSPNGWTYNTVKPEKPKSGNGEFGIGLNFIVPCDKIPSSVTWEKCNGTDGYSGSISMCKVETNEISDDNICKPGAKGKFYELTKTTHLEVHDYRSGNTSSYGRSYAPIDVRPGTYRLFYTDDSRKVSLFKMIEQCEIFQNFIPLNLPAVEQNHMGGVYLVTVSQKTENDSDVLGTTESLVCHNRVSILWQIPQYVIITAGEVMFSITGLEFAYTEASPQLKSVVQALWLFTTAVGDLIVVVIFMLDIFSDVAIQMFVFGLIMLLVIFVFILLAVFYYEYADYSNENDEVLTEKMMIDDEHTRI
uniref:Oligopeptide transporter 1 n=2 Tax=Caenorhabditis tropicalis TaxID=1561998 RepID=A0A1I7UN98_9PELO